MDQALDRLNFTFCTLYTEEGRPSVPSEPLLLGLGLSEGSPMLADRLEPPIGRIVNVLLIIVLVLLLIKTIPLLLVFWWRNPTALPLMALFATGALLIGSVVAGPDKRLRSTAAIVTAMRNPGLTLLFTNRYGEGLDGLKLGILAIVLITALLTIALHRLKPALGT